MLLRRSFTFLKPYSTKPYVSVARVSRVFPTIVNFPRYVSTTPSGEEEPTQHEKKEITSLSGRRYLVQQVLQQEGDRPHGIYLATAGNEKFILKSASLPRFEYMQDMYRKLGDNQYLRISEDEVPEQSMFIYRYLPDHLLNFAEKELPLLLIKRILKDTLRGIAALHDKNIVHSDIKPDNILVDWEKRDHGIVVTQVQLADLESATFLDPGHNLLGFQPGNLMWRSPEAHLEGYVNKPSDMFSFAIVCIYAVAKKVIFGVSEEDIEEGEEPFIVVLERQFSYFWDEEGIMGIWDYLPDTRSSRLLFEIIQEFSKANPIRPTKPVRLWTGINEDFRHLIIGLTSFDPGRRLTANEALEHRWFREVE